MRARFDLEVLPPVRLPRRHVRFPRAAPQDIAITLERGGCYGSCPVYSVTVHGDGRVRFEGYEHTAVIGVRETTVPREAAERLIGRFRDGDFWSLDERYRANITDLPEYRLTVRAGSRSKTVIDYVGEEVGMPEIVTTLQNAVDEVAGTARWVEGETPGGPDAKR